MTFCWNFILLHFNFFGPLTKLKFYLFWHTWSFLYNFTAYCHECCFMQLDESCILEPDKFEYPWMLTSNEKWFTFWGQARADSLHPAPHPSNLRLLLYVSDAQSCLEHRPTFLCVDLLEEDALLEALPILGDISGEASRSSPNPRTFLRWSLGGVSGGCMPMFTRVLWCNVYKRWIRVNHMIMGC